MKPWQAEYNVDLKLAQQLIHMQFPDLPIKTIKYIGAGWDNSAFLINNNWLFRFPRRAIAASLLQHEIKLLPFLANKLPLAIPLPKYIGSSSQIYPCPFAGYHILPGIAVSEANLSLENRIKNAPILAQFLSALHAIKLPENLSYNPNLEDRVNPKNLLPKIVKALEEINQRQLFDIKKLQRYAVHFPMDLHDNSQCLIHGDFYPKHILVNEAQQASGVIDWGDAEINHPAIDLAIAFQLLPKEARATFRKHYQHLISDSTWELALLRALYSSSTLIVYALDVNDINLLQDSLISLQLIHDTL